MLIEIGQKAKETSYILGKMGTDLKNAGLLAAAQEILDEEDEILKANAADVAKAKERGMAPGLVDRLELNHKRIEGIVEGMRQVVGLEDPVGEVISMKRRPNGLLIGQKRVPFGVIGIIYEARPNVTADAFALCFKTGNAVILRGGSDALESNKAIVTAIRNGLKKEGIPEDAIALIEDTSHETAREFMRMNGYLDVLIPRGGAGLIRTVVENSTVPVIETGTGNCHIYVDESADEWNYDEINELLLPTIPVEPVVYDENVKNKNELTHVLKEKAVKLYEDKEAMFPEPETIREIERVVLLKVIDRKWMDHIDDMDQLKQGIGLQAYGQKDPVVQYKMMGYDMFDEMTQAITEDTVRLLMHIQVEEKVEREQVAKVTGTNKDEGPSVKGPVKRTDKKIYPNDVCPCGSGKKYKNCCGRKA